MKNIILFTSFALSTIANAQYSKLLNFSTVQGGHPRGSLISDGTFLYGMSTDPAVVFKVKLDGTGYTDLLDFTGINGYDPEGSLIYDGTFLYGMTTAGGTNPNGDGTIFKIKPDGTGYLKLLDFDGSTNGSSPHGSLFYDGTFLYGMTIQTIFKIKPDGTGYFKLLDFTSTNGGDPQGSLISDGTFLYGMTSAGGANNFGVIFKIKPDGTGYTILLDFDGSTNGSNPRGDLVFDGTFLYGMTTYGGASNYGTIFKIKPDGTSYTKLLNFNGVTGDLSVGSLILNGAFLYGMTGWGGNGAGNIFKIKTDGTGYTDLFDFVDSTGIQPLGSLISDGSFLYGMTEFGGTGCPATFSSSGCGVIFKYQIATTGIKENKLEIGILIYPNPSSGIFNVNLHNGRDTKICVRDVMGNCVLNKVSTENSQRQIDLNCQPKGIYFLDIVSDGERVVKKIVLE